MIDCTSEISSLERYIYRMDKKPVGAAKVYATIKRALGILALLGIALLIGCALGFVYLPFITWIADGLAPTNQGIFFFYLVALVGTGGLIWLVIGGLSSYMAIRHPLTLIFCPILVAAPVVMQIVTHYGEPATPCLLLIITLHAAGIERDQTHDLEWLEDRNARRARDIMDGITCPYTLAPIACETHNEQIGIDALSRMVNPKTETLCRVCENAHMSGVRKAAKRMLDNLPDANSTDGQTEAG